MIIDRNGDMFKSGLTAMVNPVNCVGISGAGLALEFRNRFPDNYLAYQQDCSSPNRLMPGGVLTFKTNDESPITIFNFATKKHWRNPSRIEWIVAGLHNLRTICQNIDVKAVAIPALGCGLGGLRWSKVYQEIVDVFKSDPIEAHVFGPVG